MSERRVAVRVAKKGTDEGVVPEALEPPAEPPCNGAPVRTADGSWECACGVDGGHPAGEVPS